MISIIQNIKLTLFTCYSQIWNKSSLSKLSSPRAVFKCEKRKNDLLYSSCSTSRVDRSEQNIRVKMQDEYEEVNSIHDRCKGMQIFAGYLLQQDAEKRYSRKIVTGQIVEAQAQISFTRLCVQCHLRPSANTKWLFGIVWISMDNFKCGWAINR